MSDTSTPTSASSIRRPRRWRARLAYTLAVLAALLLTWQLATWLGQRNGFERASLLAQEAADSQAQLLQSELNKFRALPFVLAQDEQLRDFLHRPDDAATQALNRKLETLPAGTGASVVYLLDAAGRALASSNWRTDTSFVGVDYSFRPYYRDAWRDGSADYFAMGTASRLPGLYQSRRIDDADGRPLGVLVVKVEFQALETIWHSLPQRFVVHDRQGVILFGDPPEWRFLTLGTLAPERVQQLRQQLQFGEAALTPIAWQPLDGHPDAVTVQDQAYAQASQPIDQLDWTLRALVRLAPLIADEVAETRRAGLLACLLGLALAALLLNRHRRRRHVAALQRQQRQALEAEVSLRTEQLRQSNQQLVTEMADRQRTQARARALRTELEQANKLSFLGQISAGVAHEINQPLAAIRTYAETTELLLAQGQHAAAQANLATITELTERIGHITGELRGYARKPLSENTAVALRDALDGALLLLAPRARQQGTRIDTAAVPAGLAVLAERVRLEQILVNLLQNALDALATRSDGHVAVQALAADGTVRLLVTDNGPGLSAAVRATLFTPFSTSRPEGLGLGLVISRDIAHEFGGSLDAAPPGDGGATFILTLRQARP